MLIAAGKGGAILLTVHYYAVVKIVDAERRWNGHHLHNLSLILNLCVNFLFHIKMIEFFNIRNYLHL